MNNNYCTLTGKRKFKSKEDANYALRSINTFGEKKVELRVYFCDFCKTYHFTSKKSFENQPKQTRKFSKKKRGRGSIRKNVHSSL